jgi:Kef-type K+ transport system membrane component KefB/mannitol/fructose-specific phosphotransferase system IIA component (Ntr-type)
MSLDLIHLLMILLAAWGGGLLAVRLGFPAILGELAAGVVFGPALLGWLEPNASVKVLADLGVYLLMLYIGMEIQPRTLFSASRAGMLAALGGFVVPFGAGVGLMLALGYSTPAALFMGMAMGVTSLATKSRILIDLNLLGTRIASVLLVGAVFADTLALMTFAAILALSSQEMGGGAWTGVIFTVVKTVVFFAVAGFIGMRVFPWIGRLLARWELGKRTSNFTMVLIVALMFGELAELTGLHAILGAFIAGLFLKEGILQRKWSYEITDVVHDLSIGFLAPVFFVSAGFHISLTAVAANWELLALVVVLATVGKIIGTTLFYLPSGHGWREGLTVGAGMNGRGAVEVIVAEIGLAMGLISQEVFSILVVMAFLTTLSVPFMLTWMVRWLRGRNELVPAATGRRGVIITPVSGVGLKLAAIVGDGSEVVTFVDRLPANCRDAERNGFRAVEGDVLDRGTLADAGAANARMIISLLGDEPVSVALARYALVEFGVPESYLLGAPRKESATESEVQRLGLRRLLLTTGELRRVQFRSDLDRYEVSEEVVPDLMTGEETSLVFAPDGEAIPLGFRQDGLIQPLFHGASLHPGATVWVLKRQAQAELEEPRARALELLQGAEAVELGRPADADAVVRALAARLAVSTGRSEPELYTLLREREQTMTTVVGPGIAVPHVLVPGLTEPVVVVARCREGIVFAEGHPPTHAFFVIASDPQRRKSYLYLLWAISAVASREGFLRRWNAAEDEARLALVLRELTAELAGQRALEDGKAG